ncbi:hypothetical protein GVY41_10030 [Frigidibacter albus]|uniref:Uncharacterized protein n=1 Tax=Frigidibacter albus TaxID=1465486 RepID=A0A6L8VGD7_9RHOB|nr:hypothetical protein [Frigidibacter albus]MZQ89428.1 hypothetical protein [Frigidibacter albus]NBE31334.1 hypothetical protein [Frigidibacter albus]GGH54103.1 hypothetical protein GCM10011341_20260 [Frigidibacter albus]
MKLLLFIGHHKVGSTSLQDFLWRNAAALLRAGILYPPVESDGHARLLRQALVGPDPEPQPWNARESHNALAFRMLFEAVQYPVPPWHPDLPSVHQMETAIRNQIRVHQPRAVILCSEVFANFGAWAPGLIGQLGRLFEGAEVSLHCTLRRPDQYLAAWHAQRIRFGDRVDPLRAQGLEEYRGTIHLDYALLLAPWLTAFPEARLSLRNYADVVAAGGSVADFVAQSGLAFPPGLAPERRVNLSIHPALLEYARCAATQFPQPEVERFCDFLIAVSDRVGAPPREDVEMFGAANRAALLDAFAPSEAFLTTLSGKPFFAQMNRAALPRPVPEVEAARAVRTPLLARLRGAGRSLPRLCGGSPTLEPGLAETFLPFVRSLEFS